MNRRDLLKRLPATPFVIGAAASQIPKLANAFSNQVGNMPRYVPMAEETLERRMSWFNNSIGMLSKPTIPMYQEGEAITASTIRSINQWDAYITSITRAAQDYGIPIGKAFEIAGIHIP